MTHKTCKTCDNIKPVLEFSFRKDSRNYRVDCKICHRKKAKLHRDANLESINSRRREKYSNLSPEEKLAKSRRQRELGKDWYKAYSKKYYWENREYLLAENKKWRDRNPEWQKDYDQNRRDIEERKSRHRKYYLSHKEERANTSRKHRALKYGAGHESYKRNDIFERDNWVCAICGMKINRQLKGLHPRSKSIDHIVPLSKGGIDAPINVQAAHLRCNISKNAGDGGQLRLIG